jgi:hypothetical protein
MREVQSHKSQNLQNNTDETRKSMLTESDRIPKQSSNISQKEKEVWKDLLNNK